MTELNGKRFTVAIKTTNTIELTNADGDDIDGTAYTAYLSGGKSRKTVTNISGLSHLEGKAVSVLANGSVVTGHTVASGAITLTVPASRVQIGLPYVCDIELLDFDFPVESGNTVQDLYRNIVSAMIRLDSSRDMLIGPDEDHLEQIYFRTDEGYGEPIRLFTGDKEIELDASAPLQGRLLLRVTTPLPFTILTIIARMTDGAN